MESADLLPPVHPGEILKEEFLKELGLSHHSLAQSLGVAQRRVDEILEGRLDVDADMALRLARFFGMSPEFWMGIQNRYDLETAEQKFRSELEAITPLAAPR
ncbi:HigA family addiction module antitoxin [uncultured Corynebacterium sp.]|uniref:HigA family addiction module antitoxin n=1 Tax=uncultured Corynebacterium sp. TaxID=159447 RepID=UPI0025DD9EAC|nr:HigA family addiction module antitoxin [uncultured Corynebacterium sp.]